MSSNDYLRERIVYCDANLVETVTGEDMRKFSILMIVFITKCFKKVVLVPINNHPPI